MMDGANQSRMQNNCVMADVGYTFHARCLITLSYPLLPFVLTFFHSATIMNANEYRR